MYENLFSPDISVVVSWAKRNAASAIGLTDDIILRLRAELAEAESRRLLRVRDLEKLNSEYPSDAESPPEP